ncbi:MAG: quinone-dependent dihydroorotate dehydrogenase [Xanthomonadaceae bacterium]|jgi:dihydroorotate dehydrogenase|nr:quinone-dependent dihydroorotate dehydrogenase [Xanthomonadaceae bacterium]
MQHLFQYLLTRLPPERAHTLGLRLMDMAYSTGTLSLISSKIKPMPVKTLGLTFPNPVGLAAGLDKNGRHIDALFGLGFGFVEVGTVTPRAQPGNPQPRLFRLREERAVINRMGFNNDGVDALVKNIKRAKRKRDGLLGINIGRNKDTPNKDALSDYLYCLERVLPLADYVTVNISSPNTAGLRELQQEDALRHLVGNLREAQEKLCYQHKRHVPMLIKIAPDLDIQQITLIARTLSDLSVDGVIATNTTIARAGVEGSPHAAETGGLSGAPLMEQSTNVLLRLRTRLADSIPIIGAGGIMTGGDAAAKMSAGAVMVQLYTGLVYHGPKLIKECIEAIRRRRDAPSSGKPKHFA